MGKSAFKRRNNVVKMSIWEQKVTREECRKQAVPQNPIIKS